MPTFTGWTYASTGGALGYLQKEWSGRLGDVLEPNGLFNGPRFARIPCERPNGIDFFSQRDVFLMRPLARRIVHPGFARELLFVPAGSLLVGGHGTVGEGEIFGRVAFVSPNLASSAFTQDLLRVQVRSQFAELAYAFLSTTVGFRLLRSSAVGTKIMSMRPSLLRDIPFPEPSAGVIDSVRRRVARAVAASAAADAAEAEAIRIVEEEVLSSWLD